MANYYGEGVAASETEGVGFIIVGKKRDPRIQDPVIFSGKIRKNRKKSEKYFFPKKREKLEKIRKNTLKNFEK